MKYKEKGFLEEKIKEKNKNEFNKKNRNKKSNDCDCGGVYPIRINGYNIRN